MHATPPFKPASKWKCFQLLSFYCHSFHLWVSLSIWCFQTDIFRFTDTTSQGAMTASVNLHLRTFEPHNQNNALLLLRMVTYSVTDGDTRWQGWWPVMIVRWVESVVVVAVVVSLRVSLMIDPREAVARERVSHWKESMSNVMPPSFMLFKCDVHTYTHIDTFLFKPL